MADDLLADPTPPQPNLPPSAPQPAPPPPGQVPPQHDKAPAPTPPPEPPPPPPRLDPNQLAPDPNKEFVKTLPKDLQDNPSLGRYSSPEALARAYINLERTLGNDKVPVPRDPNDQEAWDRYYIAGGRPAEPAQYAFQKPDKMPEGVVWDEPMEGWWRQAAFESGLSQRQAQRLVDQYRDRWFAQVDLQNRSIGNDITRGKAELQRDWGSEFAARQSLARAAFAEMPPEVQQMARDSGLARMPSFVKYLYEQRVATTGERQPRPPGESGDSSPEGLRSKIAQFRSMHDAALKDAHHPEHELRLAEFTALHNRLFVETPAA